MASRISSSGKKLARLAKVFISPSTCIYENLAFEEWLFRNHDLEKYGEAMLIWSNNPTVVIGRHQNPWLEANLPFLQRTGISLVRRHSGGGAVYHDLGNLNISILTEQKRHNRPRNLRFIADGINHRYNLNVVPNKRDDLYLEPGDRKVSGTAARIARSRAYHHLTLLISVDIALLKESLRSPWQGMITTSATRSVRAPAVGFLKQECKGIDKDGLIEVLSSCFGKQYEEHNVEMLSQITNDVRYPGVQENYRLLRDWNWVYGKTPKFDVKFANGSAHVEGGVVTKAERGRIDLIGSKLPASLRELI